MLTDAEIAAMRADAARALPDTATIEQLDTADDGAGGWTEQWQTRATDVPCRLEPATERANETERGGQLAGEAFWTITLPAGTDVHTTDRLLIAGETYRPYEITRPRSYELTVRVQATRWT